MEKRQTIIFYTLHRKINIEQHKLHLKPGWTRLLRDGNYLLLPSEPCSYLYTSY